MNVYDFDGTIYDGDSTLDFYFFCLKRYPSLIWILPMQATSYFLYKFKMISKLEFKERFFVFLREIDNIDYEVVEFWNSHIHRMKSWYFDEQSSNDVIISASPYFLLEEMCRRIGIRYLIATKVDCHNGKILGNNCYGEEKVKRFYDEFPNMSIDTFYFDSASDESLAKLAKKSYFIKGNKKYLF